LPTRQSNIVAAHTPMFKLTRYPSEDFRARIGRPSVRYPARRAA